MRLARPRRLGERIVELDLGGLALRAARRRDGRSMQRAVRQAEQHLAAGAGGGRAGRRARESTAPEGARRSTARSRITCAAVPPASRPACAAVDQRMGDVHHVAARDRKPFGRHLPAQAPAVVELARGLQIARDRRVFGRGHAFERDRGRGRRRPVRARHQAAERVELPVEIGLDIAHGDLVRRLACGIFDRERAGDDVAGGNQRRRRAAGVLPDDAELAGLPARARAAALGDRGQHLGMGAGAVEHEIAAEPLALAPCAPGLDRVLVDARIRQADAGDQAAGDTQAPRIPAEQPSRIGGRGRCGPAGAVPRRHALAHHGGETVEAAGKLAGGADAKALSGSGRYNRRCRSDRRAAPPRRARRARGPTGRGRRCGARARSTCRRWRGHRRRCGAAALDCRA